MPFFLLIPPPIFITENPIHKTVWLQQAVKVQDKAAAELSINKASVQLIAKGGFKGTKIFAWDKQYNAVLLTSFLFLDKKDKAQAILQTNSLIRKNDCISLGSNWTFINKSNFIIPFSNGGESLGVASSRNIDAFNTYRINNSITGATEVFANYIFETVFLEVFAAARIPLVASQARIYCDAQIVENKSQEYPARAHRIIESQWKNTAFKNLWPQIVGKIDLNSGVFAEKKESILAVEKAEPFNPLAIAKAIISKLMTNTHSINDTKFKIIKRDGRFVYLNRGRAFGLEIGMHLSGNDAQLHVIEYAPWEKDFDVAVALIRRENSSTPLKVGDEISFDNRHYPLPQGNQK